jgi:hypothetical protein
LQAILDGDDRFVVIQAAQFEELASPRNKQRNRVDVEQRRGNKESRVRDRLRTSQEKDSNEVDDRLEGDPARQPLQERTGLTKVTLC